MSPTIALNDGMRDEDVVWLFQVGTRKIIKPGTALIQEGVRPRAVFIVIRGSFNVAVELLADEPLAKLKAGELIGEISFLEGSPASATIVADEESVVLAIDSEELSDKLREDTAFAARMYRAFALVAERRLRNRVDHLTLLFEFQKNHDRQQQSRFPEIEWKIA